MKILVTGGAGFIGSHLVDLLVEKNHDVRVLVRRGEIHPVYKDDIDPKIIEHVKNLGVEIVYGNLLNKKTLEKACKDVDIVYHLAAIAHEYKGLPIKTYYDVNVLGTKNLLDVCLENDIKRFVYTSSIEACGPSTDGNPVTEKTELNPVCIYGKSKLGGEILSLHYYKKFGLPITVVRPPMIYGDRNPLHARLFRRVKGGIFTIFGSGETFFEFCYVKNQAYGIYLAGKKRRAIGETYFISEGSYKIKEVVETAGKVMKNDLKIIFLPKSVGYLIGLSFEAFSKIFPFPPFRVKGTGRPYISRRTINWTTNDLYICDNSKAKKELDFKPPFSLKRGLERTIEWYERGGLLS